MLKYIGQESRNKKPHITGIPARDIDEDELSSLASERGITKTALIDELLQSGIYSKASKSKTKPDIEDKG